MATSKKGSARTRSPAAPRRGQKPPPPPEPPPRLRLEWLHVRAWPLLEGECRLDFDPGPNLILGRNGTGKTSLLKLIAILMRGDFGELRDARGPVNIEWQMSFEARGAQGTDSSTKHLALHLELTRGDRSANEPGDGTTRAEDGPSGAAAWSLEGRAWSDHTSATWDAKGMRSPVGQVEFTWRFASNEKARFTGLLDHYFIQDYSFRLFEKHYLTSLLALLSMTPEDHLAVARRTWSKYAHDWSFHASSIGRCDEALGGFDAIVGRPEGPNAPDQVRPHVILGSGWPVARNVPIDVHTAMREHGGTAKLDADTISLLKRLAACLDAQSVSIRPRPFEDGAEGIRIYQGFDPWITWPSGAGHGPDRLSFGEKRLFALLWHLDVNASGPIVADELPNGLHSAWVREIVDSLDGRQAFFAVQSPLLVDMVGIGSAEEMRHRYLLCERAATPGARWRWRNPSDEEAAWLRKVLDGSVSQMSEILMNLGLW